MQLSKISKSGLVFCFLGLSFYLYYAIFIKISWSESELALLRLQWIGSLQELPPDPTNKYADDPAAAKLGQKLFFDKQLSANAQVACATCHVPDKYFTDGLAKAKGVGEASRSAPSVVGVAFSPWFFWDGRSDSLWSQALGPLESSVEHGGNRSQYARIVYHDPTYRKMYEDLFGPLPDLSDKERFPENAAPVDNQPSDAKWNEMPEADRKAITRVFVNTGKAIAAYERLLMPGPSRFDKYVEALLAGESAETKPENILSDDEVAGLKLFIGKAMCVTCHLGPLFTNHGFHNVGVPDSASPADEGRFKGAQQALNSEFNCLSEYSDAADEDCAELKFANYNRDEILGAYKVPTLRSIVKTAPYMHAGQFENLGDVLKHYNAAPSAPAGHSELIPINLKEKELERIEAFLNSLSSPLDVATELMRTPEI